MLEGSCRGPQPRHGQVEILRFAQNDNKNKKSLAVGEHLLDAGHVGFIYERELFQLAHAAGPFCTHQVALAGVPALDLAVRRELEALPGAAVGLQLQFRFRSVSRHCWKSSPDLNALRVKARLEIRT